MAEMQIRQAVAAGASQNEWPSLADREGHSRAADDVERSLQRPHRNLAEFHDAGAVLQADRSARELVVLALSGFDAVEHGRHQRSPGRDLERVPFAAGLYECCRRRDLN